VGQEQVGDFIRRTGPLNRDLRSEPRTDDLKPDFADSM
jgi:hypothetical protein